MKQRTRQQKGGTPIIIVVPHGYDDPNTTVIGERLIRDLGAYGVINYGWQRGDEHDYWEDIANCNNIDHLMCDVVREEFLEPILDFANDIMEYGKHPNIFIIHGVSNKIRKIANDPLLDLIIGYGAGSPPYFTCDMDFKNAFLHLLDQQNFGVYNGVAGGQYSAYRKNNLAQLFSRNWKKKIDHPVFDLQDDIFTLQIEIVKERRSTDTLCRLTADELSHAIEDLVDIRASGDKFPKSIQNFPAI